MSLQNPRIRIFAALIAGILLLAGASGAAAQTDTPEEAPWFARYWNNVEQEGIPALERNETVINYDWGTGSPASAIRTDRFSAQWTAPVHFEAGTYRFTLTSDDGARVWLDDEYIINSWEYRPATTDVAIVELTEGTHDIAVDYFEDGGEASISFGWQRIEGDPDDDDQSDGDAQQITIDPLRGPVGTEIAISAGGFTPGSTVTVGIGRVASETTTDFRAEIPASGEIETSIVVPDSAEVGEPWRVLILGENGERALSNDFIVTNPDGVATDCGPLYVVQPNDWLSKIARNCGVTVEGILDLNPNIENPNRLSVGQRLTMPTGSDQPAAPRVLINPRRGAPNTTITASIFGFDANEELSVALQQDGQSPLTSVSGVADDQGTLILTIALPEGTEAGNMWRVIASDGAQTVQSAAFTVTAPGEVTATPRFNLNLRSGPSTDFDVLDVVPAGTQLTVLEASPDETWVRVSYEGQNGWLAAWLTNLTGFIEDVPTSDTPVSED